jgi:hypothetical protein
MPRIPTPLRLTLEDFDAFLPDQAAGGPATRARLDMTSRMVRWARSVASRLVDLGIAARVDAPGFGSGPRKGKGAEAQRVLIQESEPRARKVAESGARWALSLDDKGVSVALEIPASAKAAVAKLRAAVDDDERRTELVGLIEVLPEPFRFGLMGEPGTEAPGTGSQEPSTWKALLERSATTGRSLRIGWSVPKEVAILHSSLLDEQLGDAIVLLAPLYKFIAAKDDVRRVRERPRSRGGLKTKRPVLAAARIGEGGQEEASSLERGARVRVLAGPFAGKVGVVKEVDGKGGAHVMLGLLATRIELKDLSASAVGRRPTLSSSHRKPLVLR